MERQFTLKPSIYFKDVLKEAVERHLTQPSPFSHRNVIKHIAICTSRSYIDPEIADAITQICNITTVQQVGVA